LRFTIKSAWKPAFMFTSDQGGGIPNQTMAPEMIITVH
jgi:hypothetical protein